jgi:L-seryl-tRNA(Ser) seleniumtransferase
VSTQPLLGYAEPTVQESVRSGAALTCFSGDKMLGGVQAGMIVGRKELVEKIKKNPLFRTVRVDKVVFAVLERLFTIYLNGTEERDIRLWQILSLKPTELRRRAAVILTALGKSAHVTVEETSAFVGGGALPERAIPSVGLVFGREHNAEHMMEALRMCRPPVIGRIDNDKFILDLRTIDESDIPYLTSTIKQAIGQ